MKVTYLLNLCAVAFVLGAPIPSPEDPAVAYAQEHDDSSASLFEVALAQHGEKLDKANDLYAVVKARDEAEADEDDERPVPLFELARTVYDQSYDAADRP